MRYRSDWPEVGLSSATEFERGEKGRHGEWTDETRAGDAVLSWVACQDTFESELYGVPIWSCRLELEGIAGVPGSPDPALRGAMTASLSRLVAEPRPSAIYLLSKCVRSEPVHAALLECGFEQVEARCLYRTRVIDIAGQPAGIDQDVRFTRLGGMPVEWQARLQEEILRLTAEAFDRTGYSRHFTDPFLAARRSGRDYILAAMELNLRRLDHDAFLLAVEGDSRLCGFSVVEAMSRPGDTGTRRPEPVFKQLLSAIRSDYRGRGLYHGLTRLLVDTVPRDAVLLNATHADNVSMRHAYERSGRVHLADTVVMRRIVEHGSAMRVPA